MKTHILGLPRIGARRELKSGLEAFWKGRITEDELKALGAKLRKERLEFQSQGGLDWITLGDFAFYDHVLSTQVLLGAVPGRFGFSAKGPSLKESFDMARGRHDQGPLEMTKWFDTNYHYLVPELDRGSLWNGQGQDLLDEVDEALAWGYPVERLKPVVLGPATFWHLSKWKGPGSKEEAWAPLIQVYGRLLNQLKKRGITWVQIDEPVLVLDEAQDWESVFKDLYEALIPQSPKILLTTYFEGVSHRATLLQDLDFGGLHLDLVRDKPQREFWRNFWPKEKVLSLGIIDGRNVWAGDLRAWGREISEIWSDRGDNLWLGTSCSLIHVPLDLSLETSLPIRDHLAFGVQKIQELTVLKKGIETKTVETLPCPISLPSSSKGKQEFSGQGYRSQGFKKRADIQAKVLGLPSWPSTTIGSFPQTEEIRGLRALRRKGLVSEEDYRHALKREIGKVIRWQEDMGLDVLVHGEPERTDMAEYFGQLLEGYAFTEYGWVQSYGSRCVKPPIIHSDVIRKGSLTLDWAFYAQSLTNKPVKGMLTGPVTLVQWAFVREDQPREVTAFQVAQALKEEAEALESGGIKVIQVDEPAFREGLPLRKSKQGAYWGWAAKAFRWVVSGLLSQTQVHTHMCYSDFRDCLDKISDLDADVLTIETSRSDMALLQSFKDFAYPQALGPGIWDIHSPEVPSIQTMVESLKKAQLIINPQRLWVNPDCGLKTRSWKEVELGVRNLVAAALILRQSPNLQN